MSLQATSTYRACWNSNENSTRANERTFIRILDDYFLEQINNFPTRGDNILDLVITSTPNKVNVCEILRPSESEISTDHNAIIFDLKTECIPLSRVTRTVFDYGRADFDGLRERLQTLNLEQRISDDDDINNEWSNWKNTFLAAVNDFVPMKRVKGRKSLPWVNNTILYLIKKKNTLRKRIKKSVSQSKHLMNKFKDLRSKIKRMLRENRLEYMNKICASRESNPKRFWSYLKLKSKVSNVPGKVSMKISENERIYVDGNMNIANAFNKYFASIFMKDEDGSFEQDDLLQDDVGIIDNVTLSEDEIISVINNLDSSKAQGPDGIPVRLLKETALQVAPSLRALFNNSLNVGALPDEWKVANVVPVHKHGEKSYVEHYRPISLLSIISKVLERCIFNNIKYHVYEQLSHTQYGFMPGKSCITQLVKVLDRIGGELDHGKQIDVLYLDMSKAFDRVSHTKLLHRLRQFGFRGNILKWFRSYLSNRRQRTTISGTTSKSLPVTSGVPQGSILGPLLFLLYEDHLSNAVRTSNIATFADDTKIFRTINSNTDALALQTDLTNFEESSKNVNLKLNASKCKVLRVTRKHNKVIYPYKLSCETILTSTDCERDLGVLTSPDLSWLRHIDHQCSKANKILGYVRRSTLDIKSTTVRRTLYLSLVRAQLCYGSQIWAPQTITGIQQAERLQRRATKFILNLPFRCNATYEERLLQLDLIPLSYWHEYLDMIFFFKLIHGIISIDKSLLPSPVNNRRVTRSSSLTHLSFITTRCKTTTYQKSYLSRSTRSWNSLPKELTGNNVSLNGFKYGLIEYYKLALRNVYDVNDPRTWKSICLSCNMSRNLSCKILCCY